MLAREGPGGGRTTQEGAGGGGTSGLPPAGTGSPRWEGPPSSQRSTCTFSSYPDKPVLYFTMITVTSEYIYYQEASDAFKTKDVVCVCVWERAGERARAPACQWVCALAGKCASVCVSGHGVRLGEGASVPARAGIQRNNHVPSKAISTPPPEGPRRFRGSPGPALGGAVPITSATATT